MKSSPSALQQTSRESDENRPRTFRVGLPNQQRKKTFGAGAGLEFSLGDYQNSQVARALFEQEQIGTAILDLNGRIQLANRALTSLLGYGQGELSGKTFEELARSIEQPNTAEDLTQFSQGVPILFNRLKRKSGETIDCLVNSHVIYDETARATSFLVFVSDARVTRDAEERNLFEGELYRSQALQTLGNLAGGVAHDFNNALEVIIGFASLARGRLASSDPLHEPLKIIEESAKGAAGLARQLLETSRTSEAERKVIDVGELVDSVLTIITRTFDRQVQIEHKIAPNLPRVNGFHNRLQHAVLNLCINARDAMPRGGTLAIQVASQELDRNDLRLPSSHAPGPYVRIAIRDSGSGMSAEVMERIFVPLFTTKKHGQGSGMGLAMVDRVVKEAGGFVSVTSKPGEGSEFVVYLPAIFEAQPHPIKSGPRGLVPGRGTVLVVDDEPRVLEFLERGLTRLGYKVMTAEGGNQACEIYATQFQEIDCVLLDMIMPGMSAPDACSRLRDINPFARIILSSGYSSGRMKREIAGASSVEFLEKPYTLEALSQALHKVPQN